MHGMLIAGMVGLIVELPLLSAFPSGKVAAVLLSEGSDGANGETDGFECHSSELFARSTPIDDRESSETAFHITGESPGAMGRFLSHPYLHRGPPGC